MLVAGCAHTFQNDRKQSDGLQKTVVSYRYRPKGVFGKGVGNSKNASEMRQKCLKNASKWVKMGLLFLGEEERSKMRQKMRQNCVKNASKMRGTPFGGEHLLDDTDLRD